MKRCLSLALAVLLLTALLPSGLAGRTPEPRRMLVGERYSPLTRDKDAWISSAPEVAAVDDKGEVTALSPGQAVISQMVDGQPTEKAWLQVLESVEMPEQIEKALAIALEEWEHFHGKTIGRSNRYTKWFCGWACKFGWCGGFTSYCLHKAGIPMAKWERSKLQPHGNPHAVREADVLKLLNGFTRMDRVTNIPRPGYLLVYGRRAKNKTIHVGLVVRTEHQGDGVYLIETVEGNVSNRIKRYSFLYDSLSEERQRNMQALPEEEQLDKDTFQYRLIEKDWYVNVFLQTWY